MYQPKPKPRYNKQKKYGKKSYYAPAYTRATVYKSPSLLNEDLDPNDYKVTDTQINGNAITSSGSVFSMLSSLAPGTGGYSSFIGNKINPVGMNLNWEVVIADTTNIMRLVLFQWFDASTPVPSGILQGNALSTVNFTNRENIKILRDELVSFAILATGGSNIASGKWYVKSKRMTPIQYNIGTSTFQKGSLYLLCISDSAVPSYPTLSFYSRVTFLDS